MTTTFPTAETAELDTADLDSADLDTVHPLIHEAVSRQALERPEAVAMVFRDERISYATLDAAADEYAVRLQALGVVPGDIVPLWLPRSPRMVAALLGVLKCGAAYAAFDHRWPTERVASLVDRLRPRVLISENRAGGDGVPLWQPPQETLETTAGSASAARPTPVLLAPSAPACVFFTSGTTGSPKGVVSPHEGTTRLFGPGRLRGYGPGRVAPQSAPCAWDAFSLELWGMLTTGGTTVLVEEDYLLPGALRDMVAADGVDTVFVTSSLFNLFVDMDLDCFSGVKQVYTGGERLSAAHIRRFLTRLPEIQLFNAYGPVESCVFTTAHLLEVADCDTPGGLPIGRPVSATQVYVVADGRICGPGEEGEICVGGAGLATGYLGQPELTAEKFAAITVDGEPVRVYHTGDVGFQDASGVLHFRGRADRQVKVRGFRIEPGEIENAAMRVPGVLRCVVVPVPGRTATYEQLALFYTLPPAEAAAEAPTDSPSTAVDPLGLQPALAGFLPPYLVPDTVRAVPEFPMTPNGKVDEKALLALLPD